MGSKQRKQIAKLRLQVEHLERCVLACDLAVRNERRRANTAEVRRQEMAEKCVLMVDVHRRDRHRDMGLTVSFSLEEFRDFRRPRQELAGFMIRSVLAQIERSLGGGAGGGGGG